MAFPNPRESVRDLKEILTREEQIKSKLDEALKDEQGAQAFYNDIMNKARAATYSRGFVIPGPFDSHVASEMQYIKNQESKHAEIITKLITEADKTIRELKTHIVDLERKEAEERRRKP
jgi:hypothetical protein